MVPLPYFIFKRSNIMKGMYAAAYKRDSKMKKMLSLMLVIILCVSMSACSGSSETDSDDSEGSTEASSAFDGVIKVAVAGPQTGDNAEYGIGFANAAKLMAEKWNSEGGVTVGDKVYEVEIVVYDDANDSDEAAIVAAQIVSDDDIVGVIGHFASGVCMVAAEIYQAAKYVNISPTSSHADYTGIGEYIFRTQTIIEIETQTSAEIAVEDLGCTAVGVLSIDTEWGQSAGDAMEANVEAIGGTVVLRQEVSESAVDFATEIANFRDAGCDVIMIAGMYSTVGPFIVAMQNSDYIVPVIGCSNAYTDNVLEYSAEAEDIDIYCPVSFFAGDPDEDIQEYVSAYVEAYGTTPSGLTTQAYDSVGILLEAIERAGTLDREAIMEAMYDTEYEGMAGLTVFDENGDAQRESTKLTIEDGEWVVYDP